MFIVGALLLLCGGVGIAWLFVKNEERKVDCSRAILELLELVRDCVDVYSMSSVEILSRCDEKLLVRCGYDTVLGVPKSFALLSSECKIADLQSRTIFEDFAFSFGKSYREQEVQKCVHCIERLRKRLGELESALAPKRKMIFGVSICASLAVLILLI